MLYNRYYTFSSSNSTLRSVRLFFIICFTIQLLCCIAAAHEKIFRVAVILSIGGLHDSGFNDAAYRGVMEARKDRSVRVDVYDPGDIMSLGKFLKQTSMADYDLIIGIGCFISDDMKDVAMLHPEKKFAIIDSVVLAENVISYVFRDEEGAALAGALAASLSGARKKKIGFIGGMDSPVIRNFERGFRLGVSMVNDGAEILSAYCGDTPEAFSDIPKGRALAEEFFAGGARVIFPAAGLSTLGAIQAAREKNFYVIGVDSDMSALAPAHVVASVLKRIDIAIKLAISTAREGNFQGGVQYLGLKEQGVELCFNGGLKKIVTPGIRKKITELESNIREKGLENMVLLKEEKKAR